MGKPRKQRKPPGAGRKPGGTANSGATGGSSRWLAICGGFIVAACLVAGFMMWRAEDELGAEIEGVPTGVLDAVRDADPSADTAAARRARSEEDSALDPAPVSMIETVITYVPEYRIDADGHRVRQWRDHVRDPRDIWDEIVRAAESPGFTSAPVLMPRPG